MTQVRAAVWAFLLVACGHPAEVPDASVLDAGRVDVRDAAIDASSIDASPLDAGADAAFDAGDPRPLTTIRVHYAGMPGAIAIRGGAAPLSWTLGEAAIEESPDVHVFRTRELAGPTEWKPLLDDVEWSRGPNYHVAPGDTIDVAPHFLASSGRVVELPPLESAYIASPRTVWAYLPAGYDENTAARYPVVYMHDGQNLFDAALAFGGVEWRVDETLDAASETGRCPDPSTACTNDGECGGARCDTSHEAIVIGPANGGAERIYEYTPTADPSYGGGGADLYLRALIEELKPIVDATLRTRPGREDTSILGSSLGGLVSSYAGVRRADVFGRVGAMSPSTWWDGRMILDEVASIPSRPSRALRVYVDSGNGGASMDGAADTADLAGAYDAVGYVEGDDLRYVLAPGHTHDEASWALRLPGALAFLLGPREEHR